MSKIVGRAAWIVLAVSCGLGCSLKAELDPAEGGGPVNDGIEVVPPRATVSPSGQQAFAAQRAGSAVTGVEWSVLQGATGGSVSSSGLYTAPAALGTYTVVAREPTTGQSGQALVTVANGTITHGMQIPPEHPRLWFDAARRARAQAWLQAHPFTPPTNEDTWGGLTEAAMHGLLTSNSTGSCTAAINWLMANYASTMPTTGGVACDPCRWNGDQIILIYDWCHDYMTATQRQTVMNHVNQSITFWSQNDWGGPEMYGNNYYWGYLRNELMWAIATYHENTAVAEQLLDHVLTTRLQNSFNPSTLAGGDSRGGVPHEQFGYGATTGDYASIVFTTAGLLGRDLFHETDFWRELVYAYIHAVTPARTIVPGAATYEGLNHGFTMFPANDDEAWHERYYVPRSRYFPNYMNTAVNAFGPTAVGRHARRWLNTYVVETTANLPWRHYQAVDDTSITPLAFDALPLDHYASGPGYLFTRNRWGEDATTVWIQGADPEGDRGGHQHADYGTFHIWRSAMEGANLRGRYLSRETVTYEQDVAGYGGSGAANGGDTIGHNSVLVNGANMGPRYSNGLGTVERVESAPGYAYLAALLTPPGTAAQVWRREFVFVRGLETLVVLDRLQTASAGATKTFLNHCETNPVVSGDSATCTVGGSSLVMTTLLPGDAATTYRVVDEGSSTFHQYRVEVDTTPGTAQSYILTVLQAKDSGAASLAPTVVDDGTSWTLTLDGSNLITFQKGMASSGGTITTAGSTRPLRADVQTMSVTDDGPVWAP